jgi:uncharacterized membrane protein
MPAGPPPQHGFRLRGLEMSRLETFADAAFAFALTLLVISVDTIPESYDELIFALKGVPAFAASFASIAFLWIAHRKWSRRYGLEDLPSTLITLCLIFVMLVYVYPLKMVFSGLFAWLSGGWLPATFTVTSASELAGLFIVYGIGFGVMMSIFALLYGRALRIADTLELNPIERLETRVDVVMSLILAGTGMTSALFAWLVPPALGVWAGFIYMTLPISMSVAGIHYGRKVRALR